MKSDVYMEVVARAGAMAHTRTVGAYSSAMVLVNELTAPLVALYIA